MARNGKSGRIFSHISSAARQECDNPILQGRKIDLNKKFDTDEDEFTDEIEDKIGGKPNWLQDRFSLPNEKFVLQLSGSYFSSVFTSHRSLFMSGIFYAFFDSSSGTGLINLQYA